MAKENKKGVSVEEGHIVVKNKKFKITDIILFLVCLGISLTIWIYATNVEKRDAQKMEELQEGLQTVQKA